MGALSASPLPAFGSTDIGNLKYAGERTGATRLKFEAGDSVESQVDVVTGNLLVSVRGLALVGAKTQIVTGAFYNSVAFNSIDATTRLGRGWGLDYTPSINLKKNTRQLPHLHGLERDDRGLHPEVGLDDEVRLPQRVHRRPGRRPAAAGR